MKFFRILQAILREVFEESAYQRFCEREKVGLTRESYAHFLHESDEAKSQKIRCC